MSIEVRSPHSGEIVKVMPKDVGRAVKDRDGRVFYVLQNDDGTYYASVSRSATGSAKAASDHERTESRMGAHQGAAADRDAATRAAGAGRKHAKGYIAYLVIAAALVILGWAIVAGPLRPMVFGE